MSDILEKEAKRQGEEYSRKVMEEYDSFGGSKYWDYIRRDKARWMLRKIRRAAPGLKKMNVLEIGCGIGFTTFETARSENVEKIRAVDMASLAVEEARRRQRESVEPSARKITFLEGDFFKEKDFGSFDCVYMHEVFEHIPDSASIFKKAFELLKPGGFLMISTPNGRRLLNRLLPLIGRKPILIDPFHIKEYTLDELLRTQPGWNVAAYSGKILIDEIGLGAILSIGIKKIYRLIAPVVRLLSNNRVMWHAGDLIPSISSELLVLYQKAK